MSFSQPPRAWICFFSSSVSVSSTCFSSHSSGISVSMPGMVCTPSQNSAKARSNLSKLASSFTSAVRER